MVNIHSFKEIFDRIYADVRNNPSAEIDFHLAEDDIPTTIEPLDILERLPFGVTYADSSLACPVGVVVVLKKRNKKEPFRSGSECKDIEETSELQPWNLQ